MRRNMGAAIFLLLAAMRSGASGRGRRLRAAHERGVVLLLVDEREGRKKREDLEEAAFLAQAGRSPAIDKTIYQSLGFVPIATPVQNGEIIEVFLRRRMN